jgi:hypothetical protein
MGKVHISYQSDERARSQAFSWNYLQIDVCVELAFQGILIVDRGKWWDSDLQFHMNTYMHERWSNNGSVIWSNINTAQTVQETYKY